MQGVYVKGSRPKFKKDLKRAVESDPGSVRIEATSLFGNEYDGPIATAPDGRYAIVGPDPYARRDWYATISVSGGEAGIE